MYRVILKEAIHIKTGEGLLDTALLKEFDTPFCPEGQFMFIMVENKSVMIPMNAILYVEMLVDPDWEPPLTGPGWGGKVEE